MFGPKFSQPFNVSYDKFPADIVDMVRHQWQMCQLEEIPESVYLVSKGNTSKSNSTLCNNSYREFALKYCRIFPDSDKEVKHFRLDRYWSSIRKITDENSVKYQQLFSLAKAVLSISHGNVVPEREFFISKFLLSIHGNNLKEETIVAWRVVKDELCLVVGLENV